MLVFQFRTWAYINKVPLVRFELTVDLGPARVLIPAHIPFCYRGVNSALFLLQYGGKSGQGWSCTNGVSDVPVLQTGGLRSASVVAERVPLARSNLAARHTYPYSLSKIKTACAEFLQADGR